MDRFHSTAAAAPVGLELAAQPGLLRRGGLGRLGALRARTIFAACAAANTAQVQK